VVEGRAQHREQMGQSEAGRWEQKGEQPSHGWGNSSWSGQTGAGGCQQVPHIVVAVARKVSNQKIKLIVVQQVQQSI